MLSINERNLSYIKKYNPAKKIRLADNKYKTKSLLQHRGIPVPATYAYIRHRDMVRRFSFSSLPETFVVKPNRGSKGEGIMVISRQGDEYHTGGYVYTEDQLKRQLLDICDGKYSLGLGNDTVLIEEKLTAGHAFRVFCSQGLADIRVICCNLVPVAAMVRIPTHQSHGKANLAQGGAACGIEIGSGEIQTFYYKKRLFTHNFPGDYRDVVNLRMPYWNDVLLYSSSVQYYTNMGYLALDWVITPDGPKILEINARAGNEIQNVGFIPLGQRLHRVQDLRISSPEKAVEIAKSLFAKKNTHPQEKVLYLSQRGSISFTETEETIDITMHVTLQKQKNYCHPRLYKRLQGVYRMHLPDTDVTWKNIPFAINKDLAPNECTIGTQTASRYLLKPLHKTYNLFHVVNPDKVRENEIHIVTTLDKDLAKISRRTSLVRILRPTNHLEELDRFVTRRGKYNPTFQYDRPSSEKLLSYTTILQEHLQQHWHSDALLVSPFAQLYKEKIIELLLRLQLLEAYKDQNYNAIAKHNNTYYGDIQTDVVDHAQEKIKRLPSDKAEILGEILPIEKQKRIIEQYIRDNAIENCRVELTSQSISRMAAITK